MANVTGPGSSTDTAIALWNGTTGTVIQDSVVTIDSFGNTHGLNNLVGVGEIGATKITLSGGVFFSGSLGVGTGAGPFNVDSSGNLQAITLTGPQVAITAGGTANALTATYPQFPAALVDGLTCVIVPTADNTTTTPTFAPNGLTAHTITKRGGSALVAGDIKNLAPIVLTYNSANTRWEFLNPPAAALPHVPTFQYLTSGSGATYTTPANCRAILVEMIGGGGGGSGSGTSPGSGGAGGDTIFNSIHAKGGSGGTGSSGTGGTGGTGFGKIFV